MVDTPSLATRFAFLRKSSGRGCPSRSPETMVHSPSSWDISFLTASDGASAPTRRKAAVSDKSTRMINLLVSNLGHELYVIFAGDVLACQDDANWLFQRIQVCLHKADRDRARRLYFQPPRIK